MFPIISTTRYVVLYRYSTAFIVCLLVYAATGTVRIAAVECAKQNKASSSKPRWYCTVFSRRRRRPSPTRFNVGHHCYSTVLIPVPMIRTVVFRTTTKVLVKFKKIFCFVVDQLHFSLQLPTSNFLHEGSNFKLSAMITYKFDTKSITCRASDRQLSIAYFLHRHLFFNIATFILSFIAHCRIVEIQVPIYIIIIYPHLQYHHHCNSINDTVIINVIINVNVISHE